MKCLDDGHVYELDFVLGEMEKSCTLYFYKMLPDGRKVDGVTNEEVLRVLIHRLQVLQRKLGCKENSNALINLGSALMWLNERTKNREARKVEGTHQP